jgi:hypothetical protein
MAVRRRSSGSAMLSARPASTVSTLPRKSWLRRLTERPEPLRSAARTRLACTSGWASTASTMARFWAGWARYCWRSSAVLMAFLVPPASEAKALRTEQELQDLEHVEQQVEQRPA